MLQIQLKKAALSKDLQHFFSVFNVFSDISQGVIVL